jgi:hypothetical protein
MDVPRTTRTHSILICPPVVSQYVALGVLQAQSEYLHTHIGAITQVREIVIIDQGTSQMLGELRTLLPH